MAADDESRKPVDRVAAVCYRRVGGSVEFKLVRTKGGHRWTFPKGHIEKNEPPWWAAAREAVEEAGVRGRIASELLAVFPDEQRAPDGRHVELTIAAYLLEVESDNDTPEPGRDPTWFTPEQAREKLAEKRAPRYQDAYARVLAEACRILNCPAREEPQP